jgi:membrane-associated phospholipid phosphatase
VGLPVTQLPAAPTESSRVCVPRRAASLREFTFGALVLAYALLTIGVVVYPSPVLDLDTYWLGLHLWGNHPQYHDFVYYYVILGQRGPATLAFLPVFLWVAWRKRTAEPLLMLGTALVMLNVSVGVVKYAIGRVGPRHSSDVHQVFAGGSLFPSGHVANAVVLYGLLVWILPGQRRWLTPLSVLLCATVGIGTIYLRTHWFSDVVGGWLAGALVLLSLPTALPYARRWTDQVIESVSARRLRRSRAGSMAPGPAVATRHRGRSDRRPVGATRS